MGEKRIRNTAEYIAFVTKKWEGFFSYPNLVYKGRYELIEFVCPKHGIIKDMTARAHQDKGCKYCNGWVPAYTTEQVLAIFNVKFPDYLYPDIPNPLIDGIFTKITPVCPIHGKFLKPITIKSHIKADGVHCPKCANITRGLKNKKTTEKYLQEVLLNDKNKDNDYSRLNYITKYHLIEFKCPIHGWLWQMPRNHSKKGCQFCSGRGISQYDKESYIKRAMEVHFDIFDDGSNIKYDYSKVPNDFNKVDWDLDVSCPKHGFFTVYAARHINNEQGCPKCGRTGQSKGENQLAEYIASIYSGEIRRNEKILIRRQHIDICLPEIHIGFEYNGLFYHCEVKKDADYHIGKTISAEEQGIKLIHVYDKEWLEKQEIVKSRVAAILGLNKNYIHARKTKIVNLDFTQKSEFLDRTHLQGDVPSKINYGLIYEGQIVACMTFGRPRFKAKYDWELIRYSSELYTHVIGGASKLLKHFRSKFTGSIISYADRRWSTGGLYYKLGFKLDKLTEPGYSYYNISNDTFYDRFCFQKHKLDGMPHYDKNLTEWKIMDKNGFERVWDCGQMDFVLTS